MELASIESEVHRGIARAVTLQTDMQHFDSVATRPMSRYSYRFVDGSARWSGLRGCRLTRSPASVAIAGASLMQRSPPVYCFFSLRLHNSR